SFLELTSTPLEASMLLLPFEYDFDKRFNKLYAEIQAMAADHYLKVLVFYNNDNDAPIDFENAIIFRTSFCQSVKKANEFALPAWSTDFKQYFPKQEFIPRQKASIPVIGYCGYVDYISPKSTYKSIRNKIKKSLLHLMPKPDRPHGAVLRGTAVRHLLSWKNIKCNFLLRSDFWAPEIGDKNKAREEYAFNIINSDYTLVTSGGGNFSYRLYEVMSCGRIPVFINTDAVLPFQEHISWKENCIWVEASEIKNIGKRILHFHNSVSTETFFKLQQNNRNIYEEWLSPEGFHKHLFSYLTQINITNTKTSNL
ncbi:MAG: exostosin family protein, partial [Ginsengibacter sp.]